MYFIKVIYLAIIFQLVASGAFGQDSLPLPSGIGNEKPSSIYGFIRGGAYYDLNRTNADLYLSSSFADVGLKFESGKPSVYKAYADLRMRYGSEFDKPVSSVGIREAFIEFEGKRWNISFGQKILKWGRADFTNPTSKFNPQNLISRSPDRDDMDLGNIIGSVNWFPSGIINLQAVIMPLYRPSVLIIDPVTLPENTTINQIKGLVTDQEMLSYGIKADFHLKGVDCGISWFSGYDPMPGISLTSFNLDISGVLPVASTELTEKPYKTRLLGADFETTIGPLGLRGEAAWSKPYLSFRSNEYVPLDEVKWVTGFDWSPGNFRITSEYSGKFLPGFQSVTTASFIGTKPDYTQLSLLMMVPGFDINDYVRQEIGTFNRLYNNQLKEYYHSAGIKIENELLYGKLMPSLFSMYNFTTRDLLINPEIRFKPSDGLTIVAGAEIYSGRKGSLFDIVNDFMNTVYVALKVDF